MVEVDAGVMAQAVAEWEGAGHGQKGAVLAHWLPVLGIDRSRFYREMKAWGRSPERKARNDKGVRKIPHIEEVTKAVVQVKNRPPKGVRRGRMKDALKYALESGMVPEEARDTAWRVPLGTLYRVAREKEWTERPRRTHRWQAEYPNQMHQFDCSFSEHFIPVRQDGEEWILKLRPARQKNKEKLESLRVMGCGLVDDFSGYRLTRYYVAKGESAAVGITFLQWAWSHVEEHLPFRGLPDILYMDNGPLSKQHAFRRFCEEAAGVAIQTHEPERSQATGKVENNWRSQWRPFETPFFFNPDWKSFEISLTALNQELAAFWRGWNKRPHRVLPVDRTAAWLQIMERGGPVDIEPEAWKTVFHRKKTRLDDSGLLDYKGATYEVREIHACEVMVYEGVISGRLVVEDLRDGQKYNCREWEIPALGTFRGPARTVLEKLKESDPGLSAGAPTWREEAGGTVVPLRSREVRTSGFEMPEGSSQWSVASGQGKDSLEELAAGVGVIEREEAAEVEIYATPLERYTAVQIRRARGETVRAEDTEFCAWFEEEYRATVDLVREDIEKRMQLVG